jgi:hypothetical protein
MPLAWGGGDPGVEVLAVALAGYPGEVADQLVDYVQGRAALQNETQLSVLLGGQLLAGSHHPHGELPRSGWADRCRAGLG